MTSRTVLCGMFLFGVYFLLYSQQYFSIFPEFFEQIEVTLVRREEMEDDITKIHDHPAIARKALLFAFFGMFRADVFDDRFCERIDHAVAGSGTNNEIIGKGNDVFQVNKDDVFPFFIFKGVYDFTSKF